jgi:hypothetical protein
MGQMQGLDTEMRPWGMTAGGILGARDVDMQGANLLALQDSILGNVIKGVDAGRAQSDYNNPEMEMLRQRGIMGKNQSDMAKGYVDAGSMETGVGAANAKNRATTSSSEIENLINSLDMAVSGLQSNMYGPATQTAVMSKLPPALQQLVQQHGPEGLVKLSEALKQQRMNTPQHLGGLETQREKFSMQENMNQGDRASSEKIHAANNATQLKVQQMQIDAGKYAAKNSDKLVLFGKLHPSIQLAKINAAVMAGKDPVTGEAMDESGKAYWTMYGQSLGASAELQAKAPVGKIDVGQVGGVPTIPAPRAIVPGQPQKADPLGIRK